MITIKTDRIYSVYVRTSRHTKWRYSEYCGRWETVEQAIEKAKEKMGETPFEYLVQTLDGEEVTTGFVNWSKCQ